MPVFGTSPTDVGTVFDIYSIGDGLFMRRVIDSVAAMSNTGLLIDLFGFSLILGLLIMAFRNVMAGGTKLELGTMLVSVILGFAMFGMKTTVNIHDMNFAPGEVDQPVYVVANVPYGIAAAGWLVSNVGYTLTQKMETAYGLGGGQTTLIEGGFGNTLEWINSIRLWGVAGFNDPANNLGTFRQNLSDYMISCVRPAIEMGHLKLDHLLTTSNIWSWGTADGQGGIGYKSQYLTAHYDDRNPATTDDMITCEDAFNRLNTDRTAMPAAFADAYATSRLDTSTAGHDAQTAMTNAFSTIGINGAKMQDLIVAEATGLTLVLAIEGQQVSQALNAQSKMMIEQASIQRATQWSAEETMFRRIMRPMMAFFESLMYAVAPFMALMLGLGTYGMQAIGKYLMFSIWVSLWMPVLSIIELFQVTMMQHAVDAMNLGLDHTASGDAAGITMAKTEQLRAMAIDWLGTGAAMAAFTPAITMALVWGGAMTATALAGQMRGGDTVDEKMVAPATSNVGAAVSTMPAVNFDRGNRGVYSGMQPTIPNIEVGSALSHTVSADSSRVQGAGLNWADNLATSIQHAVSQQSSFAQAHGRDDTGASTTQEAHQTQDASGTERSRGTAVNRDVNGATEAFAALVRKAAAGAGLSGFFSGSLGIEGQVGDRNSGSNSVGVMRNSSGRESELVSRVLSFLASDQRTMSEFARMSDEQRSAVLDSVMSDHSFQESSTAFQRAEQSYRDASAVQGQYGASASYSVAYLAGQAIDKGKAGGILQAVALLGQRGQESAAAWESRLDGITDANQRRVAAGIMALYEAQSEGTSRGASAEQAAFASDAFMAAVDKRAGSGTFFGGGISPANYRGLASEVGDPNSIRDRVRQSMQPAPNIDPNPFVRQVESQARDRVGANPGRHGGVGSVVANNPNAAAVVDAQYNVGSKRVNSEGARDRNQLAAGWTQLPESAGNRAFNGWEGTYKAIVDNFGLHRGSDLQPGRAGADHPITKLQNEILATSNGAIDPQTAHAVAVGIYARQMGEQAVPYDDAKSAYDFARTVRGTAALQAYGNVNGPQNVAQAGLNADAGVRTSPADAQIPAARQELHRRGEEALDRPFSDEFIRQQKDLDESLKELRQKEV